MIYRADYRDNDCKVAIATLFLFHSRSLGRAASRVVLVALAQSRQTKFC